LNDTAKLQIKSEKIASFGEIFQIKEYRYLFEFCHDESWKNEIQPTI
jgi:hypothetical protein